jgi:hypothetical protein
MEELQQVFEREFNAKLQTLINEALDNIDITDLVEQTVQQRFESGVFQQYNYKIRTTW